jgi:hypothetical protein
MIVQLGLTKPLQSETVSLGIESPWVTFTFGSHEVEHSEGVATAVICVFDYTSSLQLTKQPVPYLLPITLV